MRALTLQQPWATLVAIGAKKIETRSWTTAYRGRLAIHAGKNTENIEYFFESPFREVLEAAGIQGISDLPLGVVLCTVELRGWCRTTDLEASITPQERAFGNYAPGRFAWLLSGVVRFDDPIPARGKQGLWEWEDQRVSKKEDLLTITRDFLNSEISTEQELNEAFDRACSRARAFGQERLLHRLIVAAVSQDHSAAIRLLTEAEGA